MLDTTIRLSQGAPVLQFTGEDEWIDPVIAARLVWSLDARWFSTVLVDYGGGDKTWQALATVGYRIDDRWTVHAAILGAAGNPPARRWAACPAVHSLTDIGYSPEIHS